MNLAVSNHWIWSKTLISKTLALLAHVTSSNTFCKEKVCWIYRYYKWPFLLNIFNPSRGWREKGWMCWGLEWHPKHNRLELSRSPLPKSFYVGQRGDQPSSTHPVCSETFWFYFKSMEQEFSSVSHCNAL